MKHMCWSIGVVVLTVCVVVSTGCPFCRRGPVAGETRVFDGMEFQWCPAGTFTMGSPVDEVGRGGDETQHQVTLTEGFWLGKYEVTQAQWEAVMGSNPSYFPGIDKPVEKVSWDTVQDFLAALNAGKNATGGLYRLPTESEWEYAYRAGTTTRFYWGNDPSPEADINEYAWYSGNSSSTTHDVGEKLPNAWGLYDMAGNLWEWCQDWYGDYPAGSVTNPEGESSGEFRILRGGSWGNAPAFCRAAYRSFAFPDFGHYDWGFRLLRTAD